MGVGGGIGPQGSSPEISYVPVPKGFLSRKAASPEARVASQRGTGGVLDCGTAEEDGTATWETLVFLECQPALRRPGDQTSGVPPAACVRGAGAVRHEERRARIKVGAPREDQRCNRSATGGSADEARESDGRIRATRRGNGKGTRTPRSKGGQC